MNDSINVHRNFRERPSIYLVLCLHTLIHNGNAAMSQPDFRNSACFGPPEPRIGLLTVGLLMVVPETETLNQAYHGQRGKYKCDIINENFQGNRMSSP